mmetsp:Transcript_36361/g.115693  ORF Transcript_36361/g.115693 Transcript_36361/m.115693 type:complete len:506 (+) Transcript_36361:2853-4370(+)
MAPSTSHAGSLVFLHALRVTAVVMRPIISSWRSTSAAWHSSVMTLSAEKLRHSERSGVRMQMSSSMATMGSSAPLPRGRRRRAFLSASGAPSSSASGGAGPPVGPSSASAPSSSSSSPSLACGPSPAARLPRRRPRFLGASPASSSAACTACGAACGASSSGWLRMRPQTKFSTTARACCRGLGMAPWKAFKRSWAMRTAGMVARMLAAATRRMSSGPPARATSAESAEAAWRATASSAGRSTSAASSSTASAAASAEAPRPRWRRKARSLPRSSRASAVGTEAAASSSSPPASGTCGASAGVSAALGSPAPSSRPSASLLSFFCFNSPRRKTRSTCRTRRKIAGWKSKLHCCSAPSVMSSARYAAPAAPASSLELPQTWPSVARSALTRGMPSASASGPAPDGSASHSQRPAPSSGEHAASRPLPSARRPSSDTCSMSTWRSSEKALSAPRNAAHDAAATFSRCKPLHAVWTRTRAAGFALGDILVLLRLANPVDSSCCANKCR